MSNTPRITSEEDQILLDKEARYCSFGDTVHYIEPPRIFSRCEGSYVYDTNDQAYLDLQMWYSAVNFGYANPRLNNALKQQIDTLPQIASQYLHKGKIELSEMIAVDAKKKFGLDGRVHFNVGGSQSIEDSLKVVRNASNGKSMMFAFEGGYHGRTLGASSITSSYRYRRRYGHFGERAQFIPFPYHFRGPKGMSKEEYGSYCVKQFARLFETEYNGVWDPKVGQCEYAAFYVEPIQGTGGYVIPPMNFYSELKQVLDQHGILLVVDEIQMGFYRTGKLWSIEHFDVKPDVLVFGKALTNGLNPLGGIWAREELINPKIFPPGSTHSTFASNPLGTAVGLEMFKMTSEVDYGAMVMAKGKYFLAGLQDLQKRYKIIGDVDGLGLALRMEICGEDGFTPDKAKLDEMVEEGMKGDIEIDGKRLGLILDVGGYYKNVITLAPSLEISYPEIDLAIALLDRLLHRVTKKVSAAQIDMGAGEAGFILGTGPMAVLLIHGLTGTPTELRRVAQGLAQRGCTVYVPTLAGHCGDNADLQATGWEDWYASALAAFEGIRRQHAQVFVGGLSMGAVMSMHLAAQRPGEVAGLLLYSTTLRYDGWNMPWVARLTPLIMAVPFGVHLCRFNEKPPYGIKNPRLRSIVEKQMIAGESSNAGLLTMSGTSVRELHRLVAVVKRGMPNVRAPALVLHSSEDDITSRWNADYIERHLGAPVTKVLLDNCYHMITVDLQYREVINLSADFIDGFIEQRAQA